MRNRLFSIIIITALLITFIGCDKNEAVSDEPAEQSEHQLSQSDIVPSDDITHKEVDISLLQFSGFAEKEGTIVLNAFHNYQLSCYPLVDSSDTVYYYRSEVQGESTIYYLCNTNSKINVDRSSIAAENFTPRIVKDSVVYGIEYDYSTDKCLSISKHADGELERLIEAPIEGCYFDNELIYYQSENSIYSVDYQGTGKALVLEIPVSLYYEGIASKFIVHDGKLWYCYDDRDRDFNFPLWCFDFSGNIDLFSSGGLDCIYGNYLYYCYHDENDTTKLYRMNCSTYAVELVTNQAHINSFTFMDNYLFFISPDSETGTDLIYRLDLDECHAILAVDHVFDYQYFVDISCTNYRLFATCGQGAFDLCTVEIDTDGLIVNTIYKD